jgi:Spy/CpxP family protein refolding chaperone
VKKHLLSLLLGLSLMTAVASIPASAQTTPPADNGGGSGGGGGRGGRNFDPAAFRQQRLDQIKKDLGASDDEWKVLQPKVEKLEDLRIQSFTSRMGGGRRRGGDNAGAAAPTVSDNPVAKASADLKTTLENKDATPDQIKEKLAALRDARAKAKEELTKAQTALRDVVTPRQEAVLVAQGLLE